jgi:hypothetical protein
MLWFQCDPYISCVTNLVFRTGMELLKDKFGHLFELSLALLLNFYLGKMQQSGITRYQTLDLGFPDL